MMDGSRRPHRLLALVATLLAAMAALACMPAEVAPPTPLVVADCLSSTGAIVECATNHPSPIPDDEPTAPALSPTPTPAPTATSVLGVAGEAFLISVEPLLGRSLELNVIGLDGSSRLLGQVPNPQAGRPAVADCGEGEIRDVRVSEAGFVAIPVWYCDEIPRLIVGDIRTGTTIATSDSWWFAFGPGDRLALSLPSGEQGVMREFATYELADPSAAPGIVAVPPDVRPVGWLAGDDVGFLGLRKVGEDAEDEPILEVGVLRDGTFAPGEGELHFRTGIERPPIAGPSLGESYDRLIGIDPEAGSNLRDAVVDPSGTGGWLLLAGDGALVLARWMEPEGPEVVARVTLATGEEQADARIVGISPDGSRVAVGSRNLSLGARTHLVDTRTGVVAVYPGTFAGWADTP